MRQDIIHWDAWKKAKFVEKLVEETVGVIEGDELYTIIGHLAHYHYSTRKIGLTEKEMLIYDCLIKNDLNPSSIYKWLGLTRTPNDLQSRMRAGKISQKQALRMSINRRREREMSLAMQIMEEGRDAMRRL